jgi:hypothetical protein
VKAKEKPKKVDIKKKVKLIKFKIVGSGSELAWMKLNKEQLRFWSKVYKDACDEYSANRELINHVRHGCEPLNDEVGYLGEYYNWQGEFEEYPYYDRSSLVLELYVGKDESDLIETIEISLDDKILKKSFYDGFVQETTKKNKYTKGTVFAKTEDRGEYCIGEIDISDEENDFSIGNFVISVEKIQRYQYVTMIKYNNLLLDFEKANDPYNKDFDGWIVWE